MKKKWRQHCDVIPELCCVSNDPTYGGRHVDFIYKTREDAVKALLGEMKDWKESFNYRINKRIKEFEAFIE